MDKKLRYAMVGGAKGSFIGPIHRMAIRMDDLATLVAGSFSRDSDNNLQTGLSLGIEKERIYSTWEELIDKEKGKLDFISVCTPNDSHYAITKAAIEAGFDVFCEKPLSMSLAEAEELGKLAAEHRRILAIPFTYSGFPMVKLAKELVVKGELGKICKVVLEYQQGSFRKIDFTKPLDKRNAWKMSPEKSGPSCVVADIGVHGFHLIEYVTNLKCREILADLSSFAPGNTLDDDASVLMRLEEGAKASFVVSKIATGEENGVRLRVYGDKASLYWNQENPNYLHVKSPFEPEKIYKRNAPYIAEISPLAKSATRTPAGHHEGFIEAFANIYGQFCQSVFSRKRGDMPGPEEGIRTMRFVEAALESNREGNVWTAI